MTKIVDDQITKAQSLIKGLRNHFELVKDKGLNQEFADKLEADCEELLQLNCENEKMRNEFQAKTRETNAKLLQVKEKLQTAKKTIKGSFANTQWEQFGISDKK